MSENIARSGLFLRTAKRAIFIGKHQRFTVSKVVWTHTRCSPNKEKSVLPTNCRYNLTNILASNKRRFERSYGSIKNAMFLRQVSTTWTKICANISLFKGFYGPISTTMILCGWSDKKQTESLPETAFISYDFGARKGFWLTLGL